MGLATNFYRHNHVWCLFCLFFHYDRKKSVLKLLYLLIMTFLFTPQSCQIWITMHTISRLIYIGRLLPKIEPSISPWVFNNGTSRLVASSCCKGCCSHSSLKLEWDQLLQLGLRPGPCDYCRLTILNYIQREESKEIKFLWNTSKNLSFR